MKLKVNSIINKKEGPALKILNIGGTTTVTGNLTVYECGDDIIVVDCGIGFPDSDMPGVDVIIPDFSYLLANRERVRGIFITHGHEDHFGAVPYLLKELNVPVYSGKLVQGFLRSRLKDRVSKQLAESASLILLSPDTEEVTVGNFKISAFRLNHSVPGSMGFAIRTPQGLIMHISDFKIDWTPVIDKPIDMGTIAQLGKEGVLCLLSDCLGVTHEGYSQSEATLTATFDNLFEGAAGRQIMVTTISSNISRMHQIIKSAIKNNRKVALVGRSIRQSVETAQNLGYLNFDKNVFLADKDASRHAQKDVVYLIAGCYGQTNSALARVARKEHRFVRVEENSLVIFSADPNPPGTLEDVNKVMDQLTLDGAEVIYSEIQDNLHVSGHGTKGDIMTLAAVVRPKYFMPIGGTVTKMRAYTHMVEDLGFDGDTVFEQLDGESVIFENGAAKPGERIKVKQVLAEGYDGSEVQPIVVKDRGVLSNDGVFVILIPRSKETKEILGKVDVITRGFVYVKEAGELVGETKTIANKLLKKHSDKLSEWGFIKSRIEKDVEKYLNKKTGRSPMVIVHALQI
jgi:ribonuclease J